MKQFLTLTCVVWAIKHSKRINYIPEFNLKMRRTSDNKLTLVAVAGWADIQLKNS